MQEPINIRRHMSRLSQLGFLIPALVVLALTADARKKDPEFATSADDPVLRGKIAALAPPIDPQEARRVVQIAYTTGRDLKKEWKVAWPPGLQNFFVNTGQRKGGLCFQFAERLLWRLAVQKWETLEFHWAESFERTPSEHNVIVGTGKGQDFSQGIILDNWRYGGRLVWGPVVDDPHYRWHENKPQFTKVVNKIPRSNPSPLPGPSSTKTETNE
jgi:hypothetical protein